MASSSLPALLMRAGASLERGRGAEVAQMLASSLRSSSLTRDEELAVRSMLAEAALLQDDLDQAASALGRPPDTFRDTVPSRRLATLWRLHGRLAPWPRFDTRSGSRRWCTPTMCWRRSAATRPTS